MFMDIRVEPEQQDFYQWFADFIHQMKEYFGTGLKNLDAIPDIIGDIQDWVYLTFDFLPPYFVSLFVWFIITAMIIRFLRW